MVESSSPYVMPFEPYAVQKDMMQTITTSLLSSSPHLPIAAVEIPTGCGKTLALLSSVLRYQAELEKLTPHELEQHFRKRRCGARIAEIAASTDTAVQQTSWCQCDGRTPPTAELGLLRTDEGAVDDDSLWRVSSLFFKQFRPPSGKRLRVESDGKGASELSRQHRPPPCTIFYVTRTHSQLRQSVGELRKLRGLERLKMNILGSRKQYCINQHAMRAYASKALPAEGNNLGEVCDKLVSLGQCEAVHGYGVLGSRALTRPLNQSRSDKVWDIEDLVTEGVGMKCCPYYAARDLVFFAHINFATYQYLLDPLIRHECKMEPALKNHSIIIFDEAHNVSSVCQEALSMEMPLDALQLILSEIQPLINPADAPATLSYPREFKLTKWTLVQLFTLLYDVFNAALKFVELNDHTEDGLQQESASPGTWERNKTDTGDDAPISTFPGEVLASVVQRCIMNYTPQPPSRSSCQAGASNTGTAASRSGLEMFRQVYGIVMALGVTFNPFQFSVFCLSLMKRWILILRFMIQKPKAFAVAIIDSTSNKPLNAGVYGDTTTAHPGEGNRAVDGAVSSRWARKSIGIRCLDGSLTFHHLLGVAHRVVLASGTLAPFQQLGQDLGIPLGSMVTYEGLHVVREFQYRLRVLTHTSNATPLNCNYNSFRDPSFIDGLSENITALIEGVEIGGVLVFLPNYSVMKAIGSRLFAHFHDKLRQGGARGERCNVPRVFLESQSADDFPAVLAAFRSATSRGCAVLASVFRAKVSEGIDFADHMARLVICVGVPLQPLLSWTVQAQRRYSGEEWYVGDAMRAINQALGRCIRHYHDYGAMVLLDARFEQSSFKRQLSRWCRGELKVHSSLPPLLDDLQVFFCRFRDHDGRVRELVPKENFSNCAAAIGGGPLSPAEMQENMLTHAAEELLRHRTPSLYAVKSVNRPRVTTCSHRLSCTALKLLYEESGEVGDVTASELREALHLLEDEFAE